ncbi:MAG: hypothetical protein ABIH50_01890 [bacterium]
MTATDEGIKSDILAWCQYTGNEYLGLEEKNDEYHVFVGKIKKIISFATLLEPVL